MSNIKLGLQIHSLREAFAEDPKDTLMKIKEMGYEGVELNRHYMDRPAEEYAEALKASGLKCFSMMANWDYIQPEDLESTMAFARTLGTDRIVISSVDSNRVKNEEGFPQLVLEVVKNCEKVFGANGFQTGYHNHDSDEYKWNGEQAFLEYLMENTPDSFVMAIDTGNMKAGGGDPAARIKKYPGRSPIVHIKGWSKAKGYVTPVWEADLNWKDIMETTTQVGGTKIMSIEFGQRGDYEPFDRAAKSIVWLKDQVAKLEGK